MYLAKALIAVCLAASIAYSQGPTVRLGNRGYLEYGASEKGDRVPDFSFCGYGNASRDVPSVPVQVVVSPSGADDTKQIQNAIDFVSQLSPDDRGLRGAVVLDRGEFLVSGQLRLEVSGVVLRGQGAADGGTTIRATGYARRSLIWIGADAITDSEVKVESDFLVVDEYVPVGETRIELDSTVGLTVGQRIEIVHPSSTAWIAKLGIDSLGWREGTRDVRWVRTIAAIEGKQIHLDVPLTLAIDKALCQATVRTMHSSCCLGENGIEDLTLVSDFDEQTVNDEEHAWFGIQMQGVQDAWIRRVQFRHFAGGAVMLGDQASRITVSDCASYAPISEVGGYRRHTYFTLGQQCLFLRCWSESGCHDFSAGHCAPGPNAFVNCYAKNALGDSGPTESCAMGVLYDNVRIDGHNLNLMNRWNSPPKAGWSAVNCLLWQCQAANIRCEKPPVGNNWTIGFWSTPAGDGHIENHSEFVKPISLYQQQLQDRVGGEYARNVGPFLLKPVGATNPTVEQARKFASYSTAKPRELIDVIRDTWQIDRLAIGSVPNREDVQSPSIAKDTPTSNSSLQIKAGWLALDGKLLTGEYYSPLWWRGDLQPDRANAMGPAITRFAPGRHGTGLTDNLNQVASHMTKNSIAGYDHHYGLWYDRRRDDHLMVRRSGGEVVPPFYEQPFARSGKGTAWDGLSRYDLTKFNHWYWNRLREFAELGEQHGFVLFHHGYFQHNVLEAGAHWADSPWRPANNVNETGLPEPPPYVGDKRIFIAESFYDVSNPQLRKLHRNYIRQCLSNFANQHNVIQLTSGEYTGPLSFVQFWIDTIVEWENETANDLIVALSCTKDVQDAILSDPQRSQHVDVIDIRYWTYTEEGKLYAPAGGKHLSPRQHLRQLKPASASFGSIVQSVGEYRRKYPEKAVTYNAHIHCRAKRDGWAILVGGGSMSNVPKLADDLSRAIVNMKPDDRFRAEAGQWCLANGDREILTLSNREVSTQIRVPTAAQWEWCTIDMNSGHASEFRRVESGRMQVEAGKKLIWARTVGTVGGP